MSLGGVRGGLEKFLPCPTLLKCGGVFLGGDAELELEGGVKEGWCLPPDSILLKAALCRRRCWFLLWCFDLLLLEGESVELELELGFEGVCPSPGLEGWEEEEEEELGSGSEYECISDCSHANQHM